MTIEVKHRSLLSECLARQPADQYDPATVAFYASLDAISVTAPSVAKSIVRELRDQRSNIKLIASENFSSLATQLAHGNLLTDKYAEGYPYHRFYAGCDNVDAIEAEAVEAAKKLFGAEHAYVQPHSGSDANLVAFMAILSTRVQKPQLAEYGLKDIAKADGETWARIRSETCNQRLLSMDFYSGGHLTHGYRHNISGVLFDTHSYSVDPDTGLIDMKSVREQALEIKPLILLAGYSAYSRKINFAKMKEIADEVGAVLMVDMAHFAGLVAGGVFSGDFNPVAFADILTSTTHKTLRGPRGGLVLCKGDLAEAVDKGCPAILGGPLPHALAAKALAFREAQAPSFADYARKVVDNAQTLASACVEKDIPVVTGGTDNHIVMIDVASKFGLTGRQAESALRSCGITLNRNALPFDQHGPWYTSGLRLGSAAVTTLGMDREEMTELAAILELVLTSVSPRTIRKGPKKGGKSRSRYRLDADVAAQARDRAQQLLSRFPVYPEIDLSLLEEMLA